MPFPNNYFHMVVSIDAYHYFGTGKEFFKQNIKPYIKENGVIFIAIPGMKNDYEKVPRELSKYISEENYKLFKSINYWKENFKDNVKEINIEEMKCFNKAWESWLATVNTYVKENIELLKADKGKFLNLIGIKCKI